MPLFGESLTNQNLGISSGVFAFPSIRQPQQFSVMMDEFCRETLQPTNAYTLYTVTPLSTGTGVIVNQKSLALTTAATTNDYVGIRMNGLSLCRTALSNTLDQRTLLNIDMYFTTGPTIFSSGSTFFVGLIDSSSAMTAFPTTVRNLGVQFDSSGTGNFVFSSANGTTQVKTDSGTAVVPSQVYRLNIQWSNYDSATMQLYLVQSDGSEVQLSEIAGSNVITSIANGINHRNLVFNLWIKALSNNAVLLTWNGWKVQSS